MQIKSVFFDLDGTLWDYRGCSASAMEMAVRRTLEDTEADIPPEDFIGMLDIALLDAIIEGGFRGLTQSSYKRRFLKLLERCGIEDRDAATELSSRSHNARRLSSRAFLKDDAHETLVRLKNRGVITGVVTNGTPAVKRNLVDSLGLKDSLDHIVLGEAEGLIKPDVRLFSRCIELAGCAPEETLFVGDSFFTDILGAKRAGAKALLICEGKVRIPARIPPPDFAMKNLKGILNII